MQTALKIKKKAVAKLKDTRYM